ncbi:DUF1450 domain-containing protein [Halegenticoccus tardaugens]|uniref:DUF1450 domain-containing protein n=1 Tax=Halegenticoccus tardaugens TaxID=2071624 RepID=UPI00100AA3F4|nr:DUF1450 domain-containing protein [Halegenticoccus tardaugens]
MPRYIEYCRTNVDEDARASFADLDTKVVEKCCLRRCGTCYAGPFLIVDGAPRRDDSHAALVGAVEGDE